MNSKTSFDTNFNNNQQNKPIKKIVLQDFVDDGLTKTQLIQEEVKYSRGFEVAKTKLEEQVSRGEIGEIGRASCRERVSSPV